MKHNSGRIVVRWLAFMLAVLLAVPPVYVRAEGTDGEDISHEHVYEDGVCTCGAEEPEHEHVYENGMCTCGAEEPKHEHVYENGVCTCGAEEPKHEHVYENGVCTCGAEEPEHEHVYENGVCTCGAEEPEHEHVYENGVCTCGAEEPKHEHVYENGVCTCGAEEPEHEHVYENGVCTCGATDPVAADPVALEPTSTSYTLIRLTNSEAAEQVTGGVAWSLVDGVLTISPATTPEVGYTAGKMPDVYENKTASEGGPPWYTTETSKTSITSVVVNAGVTSLSGRALMNATNLTSVTLPSSLTTIGTRAFQGCTKLNSINIPAALSDMGDYAFTGCNALPASMDFSQTTIKKLGTKAFAGCKNLTTLSIPGTVYSIAADAFGTQSGKKVEALKTLNYGGTLAAWETINILSTSTDNPNLTNGTCNVYCAGNVTWNAKYTSGEYWRYDRTTNTLALTYTGAMPDFEAGGAPWYVYANDIAIVTFVDGITSVGNNAFYGCKTLTCTYEGLETLKENSSGKVGNTALFGEDETGGEGGDTTPEANLTGGVAWELSEDGKTLMISVATTPADGYDAGEMPDYEENSAPWAEAASTITTVVFEEGVAYVGSNAFYGCETLTCDYEGLDTLKAASSKVGNTALFGIIAGKTGEVNYELDIKTGIMTLSGTGATESYAAKTDFTGATDWVDVLKLTKEVVVQEGITTLGSRLFTEAPELVKVTLPASLQTIEFRCFTDCYKLEEVTFSATTGELSLESLGSECAFNACTSLKTIDLSRTKLKALTRKAFAACPALESIRLPATIESIANECFGSTSGNATSNLEALYFGGTLASWENIKILDTTSNPNLTDGTCTVYCMEDGGIWNANYTSMDNLCYKLENGTLSILCNGAMPDYEAGAAPWFAQASEITAVIFEDGTTTVGANAFDGCVNLTDVTICEGMTEVGENAFTDCEKLANVHFYGTDSQWTALQNASGDGNGPLFGITITSGYSGKCGDNARWEYDQEAKTLTISGEGPMWDWNQRTYQNTPWSKFKDEIETIKIGYGITNTGRYAFCYLTALKNLEFETNEDGFTTVETIGGYCFCWYNQLSTLTLPEGVRFISGRAFSRCESIATVYFPSTLESIDMYAFKSEDAAVTINKVYYNGTKEDWERKVFVSAQGDNLDQLFDKDTEWVYQKAYAYYTDVTDDAWYKDAVLYLKDQGMAPENGAFGVDDAATMQWVLDALYIRAGSSGAYTDGLDWAKIKNIAPADTTASTGVSLNALADILYRTTLYNGHLADLGDGTALNWCQTYIPEELAGQSADAELTRAQVASVLAAYLQSTNGSANRYDEMRNEMKEAYETSGGDGKMHILALHHAGKGKVGDSTLILLPGGETMLIDTFRSDGWQNYLKATLDSLGVKKLDYLVLSHGHSDHDSNLSNVINYIYGNGYSVGNYWSAGSTTSSKETAAINLLKEKGGVNIQNRLRAGQTLTIGSGDTLVTVDILWPMESGKGYNGSETNDGSLTMKLTYGDSSYLCGGDLFLTAEEDILELYKDNPDILKADVLKTNHHGSYSSNGSAWVGAIDPKALITHSDDTGDSAQCYEYSRDGKAWFTAGRDGGVLVTMDGKKNITVTTGYDTNLRQNVYACGEKGHIYEGQAWEFDENGHWRRCEGFWLCGAMEPVLAHAGGTATCQHGKICETCGFEYTEKGTHNWVYTAAENVITATCGTCNTPGGTLTLEIADTAPVYDGTAKTVTVSGSISGVTTPDVTYEGSRVNAGTFTASIKLEDAKAHLSVTIGKRNATVTANDQTIAYGGTISNTEITATGLLDGHSVSATLTPSTAEVTANGSITPGAAIIMADGTDVTNNYSITYVTGKLVIEAVTTEAERNAQAVESTITQLPLTVEPDDEEAAEEILAAKAAYDALAEAEKSLVSDAAKKKLNDLVAALTDYDIIKGDGGKWATGSNGSLSFTANGPFSKFIGIEVDGKKVDEKHYTAKSGSTIITLKQSYLKNLSAGKHTITVLYTDGETDGEFTVQPEATTPATGDSSDIMLWSAVLLLSVMGIALLIGYRKRFAYKGKYVKK